MALFEERWLNRRRGGSIGKEVAQQGSRWLNKRRSGLVRREVAQEEKRCLNTEGR